MKKRVLNSMPTPEAVGLACVEYMARTRPGGAVCYDSTQGQSALSFHDGGKCPTFSGVASFSSLR